MFCWFADCVYIQIKILIPPLKKDYFPPAWRDIHWLCLKCEEQLWAGVLSLPSFIICQSEPGSYFDVLFWCTLLPPVKKMKLLYRGYIQVSRLHSGSPHIKGSSIYAFIHFRNSTSAGIYFSLGRFSFHTVTLMLFNVRTGQSLMEEVELTLKWFFVKILVCSAWIICKNI